MKIEGRKKKGGVKEEIKEKILSREEKRLEKRVCLRWKEGRRGRRRKRRLGGSGKEGEGEKEGRKANGRER